MITNINTYRQILEVVNNEIYLKCILTINNEKLSLEDLYSKLRAIKGVVTINPLVAENDVEKYDDKKNYKIKLNIKVNTSTINIYDPETFEKFKHIIRSIQYVRKINILKFDKFYE